MVVQILALVSYKIREQVYVVKLVLQKCRQNIEQQRENRMRNSLTCRGDDENVAIYLDQRYNFVQQLFE